MLHAIAGILTTLASPTDTSVVTDTVWVVQQRLAVASIGRTGFSWGPDKTEGKSAAWLLQNNGVFLRQYGPSGLAGISRRGADPQQVQVLWNNLPVANPMPGMADLNTFLFAGNTKLDFMEGGNASLCGSGNMGGTLSASNTASASKGFSGAVSASMGSFGVRNLQATAGYRIKNTAFEISGLSWKAENNFSYAALESNQYVKRNMTNSQSENQMWRALLTSRIRKTEITAIMEQSSSNRGLGSIPGSYRNYGQQKDASLRSVVEATTNLGKFKNTTRLGYVHDHIVFHDSFSHIHDTSNSKTIHIQTEVYRKWKHAMFAIGCDVQKQSAEVAAYNGLKRRLYPAAFVALTGDLKKWKLAGSFRWECYENIPLWNVAAERNWEKGSFLKANAQSGFRRPTLNDLFWGSGAENKIQPENGFGSELAAGYKKNAGNKYYFIEIASFYRQLKNAIVWIPDNGTWKAKNMYFSAYAGADVKAKTNHQIRKNEIELSANYEFVHSNVVAFSGEVGHAKIFTPKHSGNAQVQWNYQCVGAFLNAVYTGSRFSSSDNSESLPAFTLIHTGVFANIKCNKKYLVTCLLQANNIGNVAYENMPGRPMPGRSFLLTLKLKYNK